MYNTNLGTMVGYYNQGAQEMEQQAGLQTLYLMNPVGYPAYEQDTLATPNILLLNSAATSVPPSLNPLLGHSTSAAPATTNHIHQLLGIPLLPVASPSDPNNHYMSSSLQSFNSNPNHRLWSSAASNQLGPRQQQQQQRLSLSLSPHHRVPIAPASETGLSSNGVSDMQRLWMGSKYLKVAQQLLDEVVSAGNHEAKANESTKGGDTKCHYFSSTNYKAAELSKINEKASRLITTAERQDLHMKNANLVNMLEEVEQRYKLYHHHIQTVVFSFEAAMGSGAARTYTALALQTISKQFRCLKDAISAQIRENAKSLGEEGGGEQKSSSGSRLRLIDQQLRQKRAFQQIGMVQHNAWRPQRGLPERSVSILRAWLFEHFLHPYPKDSDKQLLAKQTGLTRSQVSNWFINARVRLWKPMVEEMYMEELKGDDEDIGDENSSKSNSNTNNCESTSKSSNATEVQDIFNDDQPAFTALHSALFPTGDHEAECKRSTNPKRLKSGDSESMQSNAMMQQHSMNMDFGVMGGEDRGHGYSLMMSRKICSSEDAAGGFSSGYCAGGHVVERLISEEFNPRMMNKSSAVALTLGLPHGDNNHNHNHNNNVALSAQSFLSSTERIQVQAGRRVELNRGSNNEYLGGGLNKEPSSYCSTYYI